MSRKSSSYQWGFSKTKIRRVLRAVLSSTIRTLRSNDADGNEKVKKKNNRFIKQNNNFARASHFFLFISFPFLHDYDVKMPYFAFYG